LKDFDYHRLQKLSRPLMLISVALLLMVLVLGTVKLGARRWLRWGPISFQPSELAKIMLLIGITDYLDRRKSKLKNFNGLWPVLSMTVIFCGLIAAESDLGTPIVIIGMMMGVLYSAGTKWKHLFMIVSVVIPVIIEEILRKPYRIARFKAYIQSWWDISSTSYQLNQSILALGSGGFWGKGLAQGQMKLFYLPEPHTDFIFPIIGEELGFIGAIAVIVLFLTFAWRGFVISRNSPDFFGSLLAIGITLLIVFQAFFNMGVATGILPTKGLPLPFVSFGGTALVINLAEVGILLNISRRAVSRK